MNRLAPVIVIASLIVAGTASAETWWFAGDGSAAIFADGTVLVTTDTGSGVLHDATLDGTTDRLFYEFADDGDVVLTAMTRTWVGVEGHDGYTLDPPITLVDLPLETGKTWSAWAWLHSPADPDGVVVSYEATVLGPRQVTVPAGTFDVIAVEMAWDSPSPLLPSRTATMLLHPELGDVTGLVSWEGVVPAAPTTWSGFKALYR